MNTAGASTGMPLTLVAVLAGTLLVLVIIFTVAYIYKEVAKAKLHYANHKTTEYRIGKAESPGHEIITGRQCVKQQRTILGLYFAFWIIYSLAFTFTVLFMLLSLAVHSNLVQLSQVGAFQAGMRNMTQTTSARIERYGSDELLHQTTMVTSMQRACSHYIGELFQGVANSVENLTQGEHLQQIYGKNTSITYLFHQRTKLHLDRYSQTLAKYSEEYQSNVTAGISTSISKYCRYLQAVLNSDWFSFPQLLFNASETGGWRALATNEHQSILLGFETDFGSFLEIEEVEDMQMWPIQFWQRYSNRMPDMPDLPSNLPSNLTTAVMLQCSIDAIKQNATVAKMVSLDRLDSSHFFADIAQPPPEKPAISLTKVTSVNIAEEHRLFTSVQNDWYLSHDLFSSGFGFLGNLSIDVLRVVFLLLDVLLLLYRFSNIYLNSIILSRCLSSDVEDEFRAFPQHKLNGGQQKEISTKSLPIQNRDDRTANAILTSSLHEHNIISSEYVDDGCVSESRNKLALQIASANKELDMKQNSLQQKLGRNLNNDATRMLIAKMLRSNTLPKSIFLCLLAVLFYIIVRSTLLLLSTEVLLSVDLFGVYLGAINVQVNQTNWYLSDEAVQFNEVTLNFYESQMNLELLNLQTLLEYFNSEQKRLIDNYVAEACLVNRVPQVNWTCNVNVILPKLEIPMLPCNFMPIQPQFYTGFKLADYESEIGAALQPFIQSAKSIITRTSAAIIITASIMLMVNITASLLYHHFRATFHLHGRTHCSAKLLISTAVPSGETAQSISCQQDGTDYDSEEYLDAGYRGCASNVHLHDIQQDYTNSAALQLDFKYSETKV